jgi:hypothetical protein
MHRYALALLFMLGCDDGPATFGDVVDDPQLPPRGSDDILGWIEAGHYMTWSCEPAPHPPRSGSPHGKNRICSNDVLAGSDGTGPYPVGAAGIKEIYSDSGSISLYAVYRKVDAGEGGDTWYWFEGKRGDIASNGEGDSTCTGCHSRAPRDFVYTPVGGD